MRAPHPLMAHSIGIAGTGRVAEALASLLHAKSFPVRAIAGRDERKARSIASRIGLTAVALSELASNARVVVIAVSDDALESVAQQLARAPQAPSIALHTSGSAGPDALSVLRPRNTQIGVLHPLQTIPSAAAGIAALPGSAFAYAGDPVAAHFAREVIAAFDGVPLAIDPARWRWYHAAAVMASNYQAALLDAALELMEGAGVTRPVALEALTPLYREACKNVLEHGPEAALTGPIRRGDVATVLGHIEALRSASSPIRDLYIAAGLQAVSLAERAGLPGSSGRDIAKALATASVQ